MWKHSSLYKLAKKTRLRYERETKKRGSQLIRKLAKQTYPEAAMVGFQGTLKEWVKKIKGSR